MATYTDVRLPDLRGAVEAAFGMEKVAARARA
jgi:hypothetical protein